MRKRNERRLGLASDVVLLKAADDVAARSCGVLLCQAVCLVYLGTVNFTLKASYSSCLPS